MADSTNRPAESYDMVIAAQHETGACQRAASPLDGLNGNLNTAEYLSFLKKNKMENYYRHSRLSTKSGSFRLLSLQPSIDRNAPLRCELQEVFLNALPQYEALSYAWEKPPEDEINTGRIFVDKNKELSITPNCGAALLQLRLKRETRLLFVDAICIDQEPVEEPMEEPVASAEVERSNAIWEERNQQVQLMGTVYREARSVLIWLGKGDQNTESVFRFLRLLSFALRMDPSSKYLGRALIWLSRAESMLSRDPYRNLRFLTYIRKIWVPYGRLNT
jgi:hypothetical protein